MKSACTARKISKKRDVFLFAKNGDQKTEENRCPNLGTRYKLWSKVGSEVPIIFKKHKGGEQITPENKTK